MNREIKFRAFDYFNEVMIYDSDDESDFKFYNGKCIVKYVTEQHTVENGIDIDRPIWNQVDGTVMQYTGLKDKNGKEIYEGDICKFNHYSKDRIEAVYFISGGFTFGSYIDLRHSQIDQYKEVRDSIEIIGNIYENPELINK